MILPYKCLSDTKYIYTSGKNTSLVIYHSADLPDSEIQVLTSRVFENVIASIVKDTCLTRMTVARDILLLISMLQYHGLVCL